jgi:hypothetical protein
MVYPTDPYQRSPKGDHNRRLSLGLDADAFAAAAGISVDELKHYEFAEEVSDPVLAERVGDALERLEARIEPKVENGPTPQPESGAADPVASDVYARLQSAELGRHLALADLETAEHVIASELAEVDRAARLTSVGERFRGPMRELLVEWSDGGGTAHQEVIVLPMQA